MSRSNEFFASCPRGLEPLLADELREFRARGVRPARAGVAFSGPLEVGLRACLWSRVGSRILLKLGTISAATAEELYASARDLPWESHLSPDGTFAVSVVGTSPSLRHTGFTALKVKDALVDRFRDLTGSRPNVDPATPDVRVSVRVLGAHAIVSIDLSGDALHKRGYREPGVQTEAPMKENLAAGVLGAARWREIARDGGAFVDPLCGSGTLAIEAAWIAGDVAPGLLRKRWGFVGWLGYDEGAWKRLVAEAERRREPGLAQLPQISGYDADARASEIAASCVRRAGLSGRVSVGRRDLSELEAPPGARFGLVATNPPYGGRLGQRDSLRQLYHWLGSRLAEEFAGWTLATISSDPRIADGLGLEPVRLFETFNGAIPTSISVFVVPGGTSAPPLGREPSRRAASSSEPPVKGGVEPQDLHVVRRSVSSTELVRSESLTAFENRLRKMARHWERWARRSGVTCYRVYDADLPDYAVAIDVYAGAGPDAGRRWAHVAEYAAPRDIDPSEAARRLDEAAALVPEVLAVDPDDVFVKVRRRQRGRAQYERMGREAIVGVVEEGSLLFEVNFSDYLDTGLFLDHRLTRGMIREMAAGARFCNLFAYTGTASVYAAAGGARSTTTVDLSAAYLDWAARNMERNGFGGAEHVRVRADVLGWLSEQSASAKERFELVFLDPPTFSNSKRMEQTLDIQRDHVRLIASAAELLAPGGTLLFSCNRKRFRLDTEALRAVGLLATDITARTIPKDFERRGRVHTCWTIERG